MDWVIVHRIQVFFFFFFYIKHIYTAFWYHNFTHNLFLLSLVHILVGPVGAIYTCS